MKQVTVASARLESKAQREIILRPLYRRGYERYEARISSHELAHRLCNTSGAVKCAVKEGLMLLEFASL